MAYHQLWFFVRVAIVAAMFFWPAVATAQAARETHPVVLDPSCTFRTSWSVLVGRFPADNQSCALSSVI